MSETRIVPISRFRLQIVTLHTMSGRLPTRFNGNEERAREGSRKRILVCMLICALFAGLAIWLYSKGLAAQETDIDPLRTTRSIVDYRNSGDFPYWDPSPRPGRRRRWTPEEILELLESYPDYFLDMGIWTGVPTGGVPHRESGRIVNEVQALGKVRGVDTSRLMVHFRNDVLAKRTKGTWDCTICDEKGKCADLCTWEGAMEGAPFDTDWIMKISRTEHQWSVDHIWGGDSSKDPWSPEGADLWPKWIDRAAIAQVNTSMRVAALYGSVRDRDDSAVSIDYAPKVSGALMDLREPEYRAWSIKKLIADLQVMGVDPGESAVIQYTYKPGWHTYYDGPKSGDRCFVQHSHMWTGPANPCNGIRPTGGPFARTPYGPGQFEKALNAMLLEMRAGLVAAGLGGVSIMTVERPSFTREKWAILESQIKKAPWLLGDLASSCDRTRLSALPNPLKCRKGISNRDSKALQ
jgi:hypothetical protein